MVHTLKNKNKEFQFYCILSGLGVSTIFSVIGFFVPKPDIFFGISSVIGSLFFGFTMLFMSREEKKNRFLLRAFGIIGVVGACLMVYIYFKQ